MICVIGAVRFETRQKAAEHIRGILDSAQYNRPLTEEIIYDLLKMHPHYDEKVGTGVKYIFVKNNVGRVPGFYIKRTDGSVASFSYKNCINGKVMTHKEKVVDAARFLVADQVMKFKRRNFNGVCAVTKQRITWDHCHVDHIEPFIWLYRDWLKAKKILPKEIKIVYVGEKPTFVDTKLADDFRAYHQEHAVLRCVCSRFNLSRGAKR
jgi:hypothetical protein